MLLGHDAERHDPNITTQVVGGPDLIYLNNIIQPRVKILSIINEINVILSTGDGEGAQQPCIIACAMASGSLFWPTHAYHHALANRAGYALSMDAMQLA
jgi:hypothetical protein